MRKQVVFVLAGIVALATSTPTQAGFLSLLARKTAAWAERAAPTAAKPLDEIAAKLAPASSLIGAEVTAGAAANGEGAEFVGVKSFVDNFATKRVLASS